MSWIECVVDTDYEIFTEFPYNIRRKSNKRIIKESADKSSGGYIRCKLNNKRYYKHRIVALQFIVNDDPENKKEVDHIDQSKTNFHINNLRWCSASDNQRNKSSSKKIIFEYVENISDDCITVDTYNSHSFENYYYDIEKETFYLFNGLKYRKLKIYYDKNDYAFVNARDINNKRVSIFYSKFKKQYDLL